MSTETTEKPEKPETPWTLAEIEEQAAYYRQHATSWMESYGEHMPIAFLFTMVEPHERTPCKSVCALQADGSFDDATKDRFARTLKNMANALDATGLIFIAEAWSVKAENEEQMQAAQKWRAEHNSFEGHPACVETLMMTVETTRGGHQIWLAIITRDENGAPRVGEWLNESLKDKNQSTGRFLGLLPQVS